MAIPRPLAVLLLTIPWLLAIAGFGWLVYLRFPPSGIFVAETNVDGRSAWIFPFLPGERASSPGPQPDGWIGQRITDDPVYFRSRVPGPYESVDVTLEYRVMHQPLLEFGVVRDAAGTQLDLVPMYSSELERDGWTRAEISGVSGFVRSPSSQEGAGGVPPTRLLDPDTRGLSVWIASSTMPLLADADHVIDETTTRVSLRGSHDFYFVPMDGKINATFNFQDVNRKKGSDSVVFRVFRGDMELPELTFAQSASNESQMGLVGTHAITIPNATPGFYRVSFIAPDDVFIRSLETTSKRWVIGPRVYVGDTVGYPETEFPGKFWTTSRHLVAETMHTEGLQTITLGDASATLARTHVTVRADRADADTKPVILSIPKGDAKLLLDGFVAVSPDAYFEPKPRRFTDASRPLEEGTQAVLTPYQKAQTLDDGWVRSTFHFQIPPQADVIRFVLSAPGIASRLGNVDVRKITVTYHRPAASFRDWFHTLRQELSNALHRL